MRLPNRNDIELPAIRPPAPVRSTIPRVGDTSSGFEAISSGFGALEKVFVSMAEEDELASATEAETLFNGALRDKLYDPEAGFLTSQFGRNAMDQREGVQGELEKLRQQYGENLSPGARKRYEAITKDRRDTAFTKMDAHTATQRQSYLNDVDTAALESERQSARLNAADPEALQQSIDVADAISRRQSIRDGVYGKAAEQHIYKNRSSIFRSAIESLTETPDGLEGALAIKERSYDTLTDADRKAVDKAIEEAQENYIRNQYAGDPEGLAWAGGYQEGPSPGRLVEDKPVGPVYGPEPGEGGGVVDPYGASAPAADLGEAISSGGPQKAAEVTKSGDVKISGVEIEHSYGGNYSKAPAKPFKRIVVHWTAGNSFGPRRDPKTGVYYGYHFYIGKDGRIVQEAPLSARTNHAGGPNNRGPGNSESLGIGLLGSGEPTEAQLDALKRLGVPLAKKLEIGADAIQSHGTEVSRGHKQTMEGVVAAKALRAALKSGKPQTEKSDGEVFTAFPDGTVGRYETVAEAKKAEKRFEDTGEGGTYTPENIEASKSWLRSGQAAEMDAPGDGPAPTGARLPGSVGDSSSDGAETVSKVAGSLQGDPSESGRVVESTRPANDPNLTGYPAEKLQKQINEARKDQAIAYKGDAYEIKNRREKLQAGLDVEIPDFEADKRKYGAETAAVVHEGYEQDKKIGAVAADVRGATQEEMNVILEQADAGLKDPDAEDYGFRKDYASAVALAWRARMEAISPASKKRDPAGYFGATDAKLKQLRQAYRDGDASVLPQIIDRNLENQERAGISSVALPLAREDADAIGAQLDAMKPEQLGPYVTQMQQALGEDRWNEVQHQMLLQKSAPTDILTFSRFADHQPTARFLELAFGEKDKEVKKNLPDDVKFNQIRANVETGYAEYLSAAGMADIDRTRFQAVEDEIDLVARAAAVYSKMNGMDAEQASTYALKQMMQHVTIANNADINAFAPADVDAFALERAAGMAKAPDRLKEFKPAGYRGGHESVTVRQNIQRIMYQGYGVFVTNEARDGVELAIPINGVWEVPLDAQGKSYGFKFSDIELGATLSGDADQSGPFSPRGIREGVQNMRQYKPDAFPALENPDPLSSTNRPSFWAQENEGATP